MSLPSFIFGGETGISYEDLQRRRAVLDEMIARQGNRAPQNVGEGLNALGQGILAGIEGRQLSKAQEKSDTNAAALGEAGLSAVSAPYTMASATAPGASVNPSVIDPTTGGVQAPGATVGGGGTAEMPSGDIYSSFMDTVKQGDAARNIPGITNPYGLAAVASTGKAESGFDPGNVYRQWSDPSQSGQPGNAGGIMSWRAERLSNMRNFAAANGGDPDRPSPALQAQFFLNEDPSLVTRLNAAKSPEEAQSLMNNAWKFAGYDNPNGGEAARRIATARSYASQFANGQQQAAAQAPSAPTQVASLDPAAGMDLTTAVAPPGAQQVPPGAPANIPTPTARAAVAQAMAGQPQAAAPAAPSPAVQRVAQAMPQMPNPPSGQIPPEALRALSDPSVPEGTKQAIQISLRQRQQGEAALYERQMAAYNQQVEQIQAQQKQAYDEQVRQQGYQREDQRFGVTDAREAARLNLEQARFDREGNKPSDWQKLDDRTLFNPRTGETKSVGAAGGAAPLFSGSSVEAQSLNGLVTTGQLTADQAMQLGAGKTVSGPNGELLFLTPQGVFGRPTPDGEPQPVAPAADPATMTAPAAAPVPAPQLVPGGDRPEAPIVPQAAPQPATAPRPRQGMIPLTEAKTTVDERKAMTFADRMLASGDIIDGMGTKGAGFIDRAANAVLPFGSDALVTSDDFKKVDQARRDFINAQLRRESGAVIGADEFESANKQYFPQPGDTKEVLEQKRRNRRVVIEGMVRDGGPTYKAPSAAKAGGAENDPLGLR